jgi:hypothetical protein
LIGLTITIFADAERAWITVQIECAPMNKLLALFNNTPLMSALSLIGGALITNFIYVYRGRVKVLNYTVVHDRVGLSADDATFGNVAITWRENPVQNLFLSTLRVENATFADYTNLKIKAFTGNDTLLLTDRAQIVGTTQFPGHTDEWRQQTLVPAGAEPTGAQWHTYLHSREWLVAVLNRGQRAEFTFLTTVPTAPSGPAVFADVIHEGVKMEFRQVEPHVLGAPTKLALPIGLMACLVALVFVSVFVAQVWLAASLMLIAVTCPR